MYFQTWGKASPVSYRVCVCVGWDSCGVISLKISTAQFNLFAFISYLSVVDLLLLCEK